MNAATRYNANAHESCYTENAVRRIQPEFMPSNQLPLPVTTQEITCYVTLLLSSETYISTNKNMSHD